jgi:hypothetical protein
MDELASPTMPVNDVWQNHFTILGCILYVLGCLLCNKRDSECRVKPMPLSSQVRLVIHVSCKYQFVSCTLPLKG